MQFLLHYDLVHASVDSKLDMSYYLRVSSNGPKQKVYVGLSGGVDSSTAAALLKERGFDVTGVFIKAWEPPFGECPWREDREDALRVAAALDIPFHTLDLAEEYKREVVDYLIEEYRRGRTPNPDVMCNRAIKFGGFFNWAIAHGADYVATGHYARNINRDSLYQLSTAKDSAKDQTYFLWTLTQTQLANTLFPIGEYEKREVRERATEFNLPTAEKKDSQGICFLGKISMDEFLAHYITPRKGEVVDIRGNVIGYHHGAEFLTPGKRHGFTITKKTPNDPRYYVLATDVARNTVTVAPLEDIQSTDRPQQIELRDVNWTGIIPSAGKECRARLRYRQPLFPVSISSYDAQCRTACVTLPEAQRFVPLGQSLVFYDGEVCIGGGIIDSVA